MSESLIGYLQKFTDNAHVGKIVTDIGSGFILGLGFAFWMGATFDVTVLPYHQRRELEVQKAILELKVGDQTNAVIRLLRESPSGLRNASHIRAEDVDPEIPIAIVTDYIKAQIDLALPKVVNAMDEERKRFGPSCAALEGERKTSCENLEDEILETRLFYPRLSTRVALLNNYQTRRDAAALDLRKSQDLWSNIDYLFGRLEILVFIGGLLGVVLSQVSRQLIIRWGYQWVRRKWPTRSADPGSAVERGVEIKTVIEIHVDITDRLVDAIARRRIRREEHDILVSDHFRYAEASANMVIPTLVFGVGFIRYMVHIQSSSPLAMLTIGSVTVLSAVILFFSGYWSNESYLRKVEMLLDGIKDNPPEQAPLAAPTAPADKP